MIRVMLTNYWTTIFGFLAGMVYYLSQQGASLPTDRRGWWDLIVATVLAGIGAVSKDATTGSKPKPGSLVK
jgi:hypothetical protein